ncbi:MAG: hypothetical protein AAF613_09730, partial [Pseudomonadota bacterium]
IVSEKSGDNAVLTVLTDAETQDYVAALTRMSPDAAQRLDEAAREAIATGAKKQDVAMLINESFNYDLAEIFKRMPSMDVTYVNELIDLSSDAMRQLSSSRSKWCKAGTYEKMQYMSEKQAMEFGQSFFDYGTPFYTYAVRVNTILFNGVADARKSPARYGKLTSSDEAALQSLMFSMMMDPEVQSLMAMGSGRMNTQALARVDLCKLGLAGIDAVAKLPNETKGRLWAEGMRQIDSGEITKQLQGLQMSAF